MALTIFSNTLTENSTVHTSERLIGYHLEFEVRSLSLTYHCNLLLCHNRPCYCFRRCNYARLPIEIGALATHVVATNISMIPSRQCPLGFSFTFMNIYPRLCGLDIIVPYGILHLQSGMYDWLIGTSLHWRHEIPMYMRIRIASLGSELIHG